jgi:hypothetical protein
LRAAASGPSPIGKEHFNADTIRVASGFMRHAGIEVRDPAVVQNRPDQAPKPSQFARSGVAGPLELQPIKLDICPQDGPELFQSIYERLLLHRDFSGFHSHPWSRAVREFDPSGLKGGADRHEIVDRRDSPSLLKIPDGAFAQIGAQTELGLRPI